MKLFLTGKETCSCLLTMKVKIILKPDRSMKIRCCKINEITFIVWWIFKQNDIQISIVRKVISKLLKNKTILNLQGHPVPSCSIFDIDSRYPSLYRFLIILYSMHFLLVWTNQPSFCLFLRRLYSMHFLLVWNIPSSLLSSLPLLGSSTGNTFSIS